MNKYQTTHYKIWEDGHYQSKIVYTVLALKGIGPTTACAPVASIGNAHDFKNGRQLAVWLGLASSQYSSGGKSKLGRIVIHI